jgi:hypothetical protein
MKTYKSAFLKRTLIVLMVTILLLVPASAASANLKGPGGYLPYFTHIGFLHTDDVEAIIFYFDPECIPAGFNLLDFFTDTSGCVPTTSGFMEIKPDAFAPMQNEIKGLGAVPVWFVSWTELQGAMADGFLFIDELRSLPSLLIGSASYYHETFHPIEGAPNGVGLFNATARGMLNDGKTTFTVHASSSSPKKDMNTISIEFK